jgi:glycosyltransferase involved in cell wall biosynthesis
MHVVIIADRCSCRGGADQHLLDVLARLARDPQIERLELIVGADDGTARPPCPARVVPGVDARQAQPLATSLELDVADVVHLHNIVNPWLLEEAARWPALATVQDHRPFCPGQGKLDGQGQRCELPFAESICRPCLGDSAYAERMVGLTERRRSALAALRAVVVLSRYMERELGAVGVAPERVAVVPPFVELEALAGDAPQVEPCVLFVGRLVGSKGVDDALGAHAASGTSLPLIFAGTGSQRQRLERQGAHVTGWVDRATLGAHYRAARALLLPSRWQEPFGIVGLEALSLGVPVVAYDSGGIAEWHPGAAHGLCRLGDVEALGHGLQRVLLERPDVQPPVGFEAERQMARLLAVYRAVAG